MTHDAVGDRLSLMVALLALATRRVGPFLPLCGLPQEIVRSPDPLRLAARSAVEEFRKSDAVARAGESGLERGSVLGRFLDAIERGYGRPVSVALEEWIVRFHLDSASRGCLSGWEIVLLLESRSMRPHSLELEPTLGTAIHEIALDRFGPPWQERLSRAESLAASIPIAADEEGLVALEVVDPGDLAQWDVVMDMTRTASLSTASDALQDLERQLTQTDIDAAVNWAAGILAGRGDRFHSKHVQERRCLQRRGDSSA